MKDIDFTDCEFIAKDMSYLTYFDFCDNCFAIKKMYISLNRQAKRFYKYYVYSNIHMTEFFKNSIWDFLNSSENESYINLIINKAKYKII